MRYLFDIGHPAEAHCFKNIIQYLKKNHHVIVTARDKDITLYLLNHYNIPHICTGKNLKSKIGKIYSLFRNDYSIFKEARVFKPDIIVSFFSPFAAHVGKLLRKPVIGFHDTEHANLAIKLTKPFTNCIVVPNCYKREYPGKKVIRFKGNFELAYLHPAYFTPNPSIFKLLNIKKNEKFVIIRFVTHSSIHDIGYKGLTIETKIRAVQEFSKIVRVFISSEVPLPENLKSYKIKIPPEKMHDALYYATLLYGESSTMASESAVLGTPAIYLDFKGRGYTDEEEKKYGLIFNYTDSLKDQEKSVDKGVELLKTINIKQKWRNLQKKFLENMIDVNAFMKWFLENHPESEEIMLKNPNYQLKFK